MLSEILLSCCICVKWKQRGIIYGEGGVVSVVSGEGFGVNGYYVRIIAVELKKVGLRPSRDSAQGRDMSSQSFGRESNLETEL